jgi:hypothetical protein
MLLSFLPNIARGCQLDGNSNREERPIRAAALLLLEIAMNLRRGGGVR